MVSLFGKPVLEHILLLLRKNGVEEAAITLHYLPEAVTGYFGDGSRWGCVWNTSTRSSPWVPPAA